MTVNLNAAGLDHLYAYVMFKNLVYEILDQERGLPLTYPMKKRVHHAVGIGSSVGLAIYVSF
jgi:hypothetical protein